MTKRPSIKESFNKLKMLAKHSVDAQYALACYDFLLPTDEFRASKMIVDIVDHYNHITGEPLGS